MLSLSLKYAYRFYFPACIQINYFSNLNVLAVRLLCGLLGFHKLGLLRAIKEFLEERVGCTLNIILGEAATVSSTEVMLLETSLISLSLS